MTRRLCVLAGALAFVLVPKLVVTQTVFRSSIDVVSVDVAVHQNGEQVTTLSAADFEVRDNRAVQRILDVSRETLPIDVTLVVDLSGSVEGPLLASLERAIGAVRARLRPADRVSLVTFNHRIQLIAGLGDPEPQGPAQALGDPGGATSLFDAMAASLVAPSTPGRRHMAIVFTDGVDTSSFLGESAVTEIATRGGMTVFAVAVADGTTRSPRRPAHEAFFNGVTTATGGSFVALQRDEDLGASFLGAFDEFRSSYVIRFSPTAPAPGWHDIDVRVVKAGRYDLRARKGYLGGE